MTVHHDLVRAAKAAAVAHWPDRHGLCPVCRIPACTVWLDAIGLLGDIADLLPIVRPRP